MIPFSIDPADFVGYDPITGCLYYLTSNVTKVDMFSAYFMMLDCRTVSHVMVTLDGFGQTRLLAKSGQKASLSRFAKGRKPTRQFEIEPTIGENGDLVDLRIYFEDKTGSRKSFKLNSALTLQAGDWTDAVTGAIGSRGNSSLRLKAEIIRSAP